MEALNVVGYITSEPLTDGLVSHSVQNMTIKNFITQQKKNFLLSWTEYMGKSGVVLESLLQEKFYDGICLYSLEQLWQMPNAQKTLQDLKSRSAWIGFAREGIFFHTAEEFQKVQKLFWLKSQVEKNQSLWAN